MRTKSWQFCLVVAGILLICVPEVLAQTNRSGYSSTSVTTPSDGSTAVAEWYGPFASWDNVKTKYGAVGDGATDDTAAISNALANVGLGGNSPVLYFPSGTYRVTHKLWLHGKQNVEILGYSAATTVLRYDGATDSNFSGPSTLFHLQGITGCHFARLAFDGNGKSKTVVSQSEYSSDFPFDYYNSWEDCVFTNAAAGGHAFDAGYFGWGCAAVDFVRCVFGNASVGLFVGNWNALNEWLTECYMANCGTAIEVKQGSASAYRTTFANNQTDFLLDQAAPFIALVGNVSYHSGVFCRAVDVGFNQTPFLLKGNTVIDPTGTAPIVMGQPGPVVMLDNVIANTNGAALAFSNGYSLQGDLVAVGNTNVVSSWITVAAGSGLRTDLVDNVVVPRSSLTLSVPPLPTPAANLSRTVVDTPAGFTAASLQTEVDGATDGTVIHIPWANNSAGYFSITAPVTIPSGKDVRIVGDGFASKLSWGGTPGGTMFVLPHPSHATLSHLYLDGGNAAAGALVAVTNVGSSSARVYARDSCSRRGSVAGVRMGDCPNATVDYYGMFIAANAQSPVLGTAILLDGGGKVKYINSDGGATIYDDSTLIPVFDYVCTNGGSLYIEGCYHECEYTRNEKLFQASGNSTVTFMCGTPRANLDPSTDLPGFARATTNGYAATDFTGRFLVALATGVMDYCNVSGATTGNIWVLGSTTGQFPGSSWPVVNTTGDAVMQTMNWNWDSSAGLSRYANVGTASDAYVRQMLAQARTEYSDLSPMARRTNQTDVLLDHVSLELGQNNLWVKP
ncbi:MAG TPA: glycosyl hydrolase family 28-related protein [Verrucomicrobiae bacterium]|nr:glycosyl hydrolase family 28-related protein [Verrucomicrobiae bacterium]